jgi:hypothetical protein
MQDYLLCFAKLGSNDWRNWGQTMVCAIGSNKNVVRPLLLPIPVILG